MDRAGQSESSSESPPGIRVCESDESQGPATGGLGVAWGARGPAGPAGPADSPPAATRVTQSFGNSDSACLLDRRRQRS